MLKRMRNKGFTLIELIIVLVLIGILAAVAIPQFVDLSGQANEASVRGTLGNVRSAITIWRANNMANNPGTSGQWPTINDVRGTTASPVLSNPMPANLYQTNTATAADVRDAGAGTMGSTSGNQGWAYDATTGNFWANTRTSGVLENGW